MLVTRLSQQQATSRWLAERSSEAENKHLEAVARLIDQNGEGWPDLNPSEKDYGLMRRGLASVKTLSLIATTPLRRRRAWTEDWED